MARSIVVYVARYISLKSIPIRPIAESQVWQTGGSRRRCLWRGRRLLFFCFGWLCRHDDGRGKEGWGWNDRWNGRGGM